MIWCLLGLALLAALAGLAALMVRRPPIHTRQVRPGMALRGCVAVVCLLAALGLVGMMLVLALAQR